MYEWRAVKRKIVTSWAVAAHAGVLCQAFERISSAVAALRSLLRAGSAELLRRFTRWLAALWLSLFAPQHSALQIFSLVELSSTQKDRRFEKINFCAQCSPVSFGSERRVSSTHPARNFFRIFLLRHGEIAAVRECTTDH